MAEIWVFGNPDLSGDNLPLQLLSRLQADFTRHTIVHQDPLDEWEMPDPLYIIDTVQGIESVQQFNSLEAFENSPHVTMHDYDLGTQLQFMQKLGKLPQRLVMFGIPPSLTADAAYGQLVHALRQSGL